MSNDAFEAMKQISEREADSSFDARVEHERRTQNRSRRIRKICRLTILLAGLGALAAIYAGDHLGSGSLGSLG